MGTRLGDPVVAARACRSGVRLAGPGPRPSQGLGRRLRGGSLDGPGGDRPGRPGAGDHARPAGEVPVPPGGVLRLPRCLPRCATSSAGTQSGRSSSRWRVPRPRRPVLPPPDRRPRPRRPTARRPRHRPCRRCRPGRTPRARCASSASRPRRGGGWRRQRTLDNPLREGLRLERVPDPAAFVLFGATGDLAHRKVVPALYQLWRTHLLPHEFMLVAVGRRPFTDEAFRKELRTSLDQFSRVQPVDSDTWDDLAVAHRLPPRRLHRHGGVRIARGSGSTSSTRSAGRVATACSTSPPTHPPSPRSSPSWAGSAWTTSATTADGAGW